MIELNKIYNMDCLEGMKQINKSSVDAVITDPPYYIATLQKNLKGETLRSSSKNNIFFNEFDHFKNLKHYQAFCFDFLNEIKRVLKPKGQVYMFFSTHHLKWIINMIEDLDFHFYQVLIWYKPETMGIFPNQYGWNYEPILWFRKDYKGGSCVMNIGNSQRNVFTFTSTKISARKEAGFHPTVKPLPLVRQLIKNCTHEGGVVLDPFVGSGTTAVAAYQIKRKFIGFERDADYFKFAEGRLKHHMQQKKLNELFAEV